MPLNLHSGRLRYRAEESAAGVDGRGVPAGDRRRTTVRWRNVELPRVQSPRVDLLGETAEGQLVHIELQNKNGSTMALRMLGYALAIKSEFGRFPAQILLYTGQPGMNMPDRIEEGAITYQYRSIDIREVDAEPLLASPNLEDNVIAVLLRLADQRATVRRILKRIAQSDPSERGVALRNLEILAGLRTLERAVKEETTGMPILDDIMDHEVLGPKYREGLEHGKAEGFAEGERQAVRRIVEKRFGALPKWAERRFGSLSVREIESVSLSIFEASPLKICSDSEFWSADLVWHG